MSIGGRGQRLLAKRYPVAVMLSCAFVSIGIRTALHSDGLTGRIANIAAIGFATVGIVTVAYLVIRFRINDRRTDDRIDELLAQRVRPNVRHQDDR